MLLTQKTPTTITIHHTLLLHHFTWDLILRPHLLPIHHITRMGQAPVIEAEVAVAASVGPVADMAMAMAHTEVVIMAHHRPSIVDHLTSVL